MIFASVAEREDHLRHAPMRDLNRYDLALAAHRGYVSPLMHERELWRRRQS